MNQEDFIAFLKAFITTVEIEAGQLFQPGFLPCILVRGLNGLLDVDISKYKEKLTLLSDTHLLL